MGTYATERADENSNVPTWYICIVCGNVYLEGRLFMFICLGHFKLYADAESLDMCSHNSKDVII